MDQPSKPLVVRWSYYLPMDCPRCDRRRLEYGLNANGNVIYVECEKCGANSDDESLDGAD